MYLRKSVSKYDHELFLACYNQIIPLYDSDMAQLSQQRYLHERKECCAFIALRSFKPTTDVFFYTSYKQHPSRPQISVSISLQCERGPVGTIGWRRLVWLKSPNGLHRDSPDQGDAAAVALSLPQAPRPFTRCIRRS